VDGDQLSFDDLDDLDEPDEPDDPPDDGSWEWWWRSLPRTPPGLDDVERDAA
jgi:hypothetical protein